MAGPTSLSAERSSAQTEGLEMYLWVCAHYASRAAAVSAVLSLGSGQSEQPRAERHVSSTHPPGQAELGFTVCVGAWQRQCAQLNAAAPGCSPLAELLSCSLSKAGSEAPHVIFESVPCVACLTWPLGPSHLSTGRCGCRAEMSPRPQLQCTHAVVPFVSW